jgi:hypothetical protein
MSNQRINSTSGVGGQTASIAGVTEGNLLIPDISGFTRFVQVTDITTGSYVISKLLAVLLDSNMLGLKVSEIEGDAILFYKSGERLSRKEILTQFDTMQERFRRELLSLSMETNVKIDLGLKLIAHYGSFSKYQIGGFTKLYGTSVIEAHRLLKNSIVSNEYVIMTDNLLNSKTSASVVAGSGNRICENYSPLENVCFTWLGYPQALMRPAM